MDIVLSIFAAIGLIFTLALVSCVFFALLMPRDEEDEHADVENRRD